MMWQLNPGGGVGGTGTNLSYDVPTQTIQSDTGTDAVIPLATIDSPGLAARPQMGPDRFQAFTDFMNTTTSEFWAISNAGTGAALTSTATPYVDGIGWVRADLGTTATGRAAWGATGWGMMFGNGRATAKMRNRILNLSDATNTWTFRCGFGDNLVAEPTDGVYFRYTHSVNGGRFQAITRSNGTETVLDTGITVAAATTYNFRIDVADDASAVNFYIGGALVGTSTTNIPTGVGRETGFILSHIRSAGTAAFQAAACDYLWVEQVFTGRE